MLDRKTKNLEANVELLKDRKKSNAYIAAIAVFVGTVSFVVGVALSDMVCLYFGIVLFIFTGMYVIFDHNYENLIQSRRIIETQRDHTILIDDILTNLEKQNKKKKSKTVKKK